MRLIVFFPDSSFNTHSFGQLPVVFKGTRYKGPFGGLKTDITHGRVLAISVNIPTKAFCPQCVSGREVKVISIRLVVWTGLGEG